jgi:hypothetical protein
MPYSLAVMQYSRGIGNCNNNEIKKGNPGDMIVALREEMVVGAPNIIAFLKNR